MVELTNRELMAAIRGLEDYHPGWGKERDYAVSTAIEKLRWELAGRLAEAERAKPKRKRGEKTAMIAELREAALNRVKVELTYIDAYGDLTVRTVCPIGFTDAAQTKMLSAWCELRDELRHFRTDRIAQIVVLGERFANRHHAYG